MIHFDEATHTYWHNGKQLPGVTSILAPLKDYSMVNKDVLEAAAERGSYVHLCTELYDRDELDLESPDLLHRGYVEAWVKFRRETGFTPTAIEQVVFHPTHLYAGKLDREGYFSFGPDQDDLFTLDVKTVSGKLTDEVGIQLVAYQEARRIELQKLNAPIPTRRIAIQLREDGTYRRYDYNDKTDFAVFLSLLTVQRWKEARK